MASIQVFLCACMYNTELNDLRIIICLRKSEDTVTVCNVIENLAGHGIQSLPCCYTSDVINMLP